MSDVMVNLVIAECKHAVEECKGDVKAKLLAAMNAAKDHWMVLDKEIQFKGAVASVLLHYPEGSEERKRIEHELAVMRRFNAMIVASNAGLSVSLPEAEDEEKHEPLAMVGMWHDVTGKK